jgi:hypothetical protein
MKGLKETNCKQYQIFCFLVEIVKFDEFEKLSCIGLVQFLSQYFGVKLML